MSKISPTDKLFDVLIPDSPEYWQAIENIDFEPKQIVDNRKSFISLLKEIPDYLLSLGLLFGVSLFFDHNIFDDSGIEPESDTVFTPIRKNIDLDDYLEGHYPDMNFSVMRREVRISSKLGNIKINMSLAYEPWDIESEQEYQDLLSKIERGVNSIRFEQSKPNRKMRRGVVVLGEHS
jgi:hypothetical protein